MKKLFFLLVIMQLYNSGVAQTQQKIDSLLITLSEMPQDSGKVNIYLDLSELFYMVGQFEKCAEYAMKAHRLGTDLGDNNGIINGLINTGAGYSGTGNQDTALIFYERALTEAIKYKDSVSVATIYNNMGYLYDSKGMDRLALKQYQHSLRIRENLRDSAMISISLNQIAHVLDQLGDYDLALQYYKQCLKIRESLDDNYGIALVLNNIGALLDNTGKSDQALEVLERSRKIREKSGDKLGLAYTLNNIGVIYRKRKQYDKALEYFRNSLLLREEINHVFGKGASYNNIGGIYFLKEEYNQALHYFSMGYEIGTQTSNPRLISKAAEFLNQIYEKQEKFRKAYHFHVIYKQMNDSLQNDGRLREITRMEAQYKYDKKHREDSILQVQQELLHKEEVRRHELMLQSQRNMTYSISSGLLLVLSFALFIYRSYTRKKRDNEVITLQKKEVEQQKELLEYKNKEILDSITYARRLQEAILPPKALVKEWLSESFILYKPKDIIAGDFYWMESVGDTIYFAAADCTGHGVPGAMVSVVCSHSLSKSLIEEKIFEPSKILDRTRELVIERFKKSVEEVKDGMDISLCALNVKTKQLQWSGANNPLWIVNPSRNNWPEQCIPFQKLNGGAEIKADKQPIGKYVGEKPFTNHEMQLEEGDIIYMFSDGYPDQFGGEKGKKFKSANFKRLLVSIYKEPMPTQKVLIDETFENWKGDLDQIDDVCVIGVKV